MISKKRLLSLEHLSLYGGNILESSVRWLTSQNYKDAFDIKRSLDSGCEFLFNKIADGLKMYEIDHANWIEFDLSKNFDKGFSVLKSLSIDTTFSY